MVVRKGEESVIWLSLAETDEQSLGFVEETAGGGEQVLVGIGRNCGACSRLCGCCVRCRARGSCGLP